MKNLKKGLLATAAVASMLVLTACTSGESKTGNDPNTTLPPASDQIFHNVEFTSEQVKDFRFEDIEDVDNSVSDLAENSFTLIHGGSGSCPNIVDTITVDQGSSYVSITFKELPENTPCTADYQLRADRITLTEPLILDPEQYVYIIQTGDESIFLRTPAMIAEEKALAEESENTNEETSEETVEEEIAETE